MIKKHIKLFKTISIIKQVLLELIFPRYCLGCNLEGSSAGGWLCSECAQKIIPVVSQVCPKCGRLSENGRFCELCRVIKLPKEKGEKKSRTERMKLNGVICAAYFEEGPIREMIHNFKYNGVTELADKLAGLMAEAFSSCHSRPVGDRIGNLDPRCRSSLNADRLGDDDLVVTFVPLHWRRQATRGYNQSEILARQVGPKLGIEVHNLLKKQKSTKRQVELQGYARRKNLRAVFVARRGQDIKNKKIIIVDDITTTGSTLNECARVLKAVGAKEVWGLVVARG